jgi:hypothetical protein
LGGTKSGDLEGISAVANSPHVGSLGAIDGTGGILAVLNSTDGVGRGAFVIGPSTHEIDASIEREEGGSGRESLTGGIDVTLGDKIGRIRKGRIGLKAPQNGGVRRPGVVGNAHGTVRTDGEVLV